MKKIIQNVEPVIVSASGEEAILAQANLSEEKDITSLLGDSNETKDCVRRERPLDTDSKRGDGRTCGERDGDRG